MKNCKKRRKWIFPLAVAVIVAVAAGAAAYIYNIPENRKARGLELAAR